MRAKFWLKQIDFFLFNIKLICDFSYNKLTYFKIPLFIISYVNVTCDERKPGILGEKWPTLGALHSFINFVYLYQQNVNRYSRPPDKSAYQNFFFYFSTKTYVVQESILQYF